MMMCEKVFLWRRVVYSLCLAVLSDHLRPAEAPTSSVIDIPKCRGDVLKIYDSSSLDDEVL